MIEENFSDEDQQLFLDIEVDIKAHPKEYRQAGKWLDEYYSVENFWQRKEDHLNYLYWKKKKTEDETGGFCPEEILIELVLWSMMIELKAYQPISQLLEICNAERKIDFYIAEEPYKVDGYGRAHQVFRFTEDEVSKAIERKLKLHKEYFDGVRLEYRLLDACDSLLEIGEFISAEQARCICLVMWLLTDPDADVATLNLTKFEKWPWEEPGWALDRGEAITLIHDNKDAWMKLVRRAWAKLKAQKYLESNKSAGTEQKNKPYPKGFEQFTDEDQQLFHKIEMNIKNNPDKYREAGKRLDEFYSEAEYWKNRELELRCCSAFTNPNRPISSDWVEDPEFQKNQKKRKKELELLLRKKDKPPLTLRLQFAWSGLEVNYICAPFLSDLQARVILLIVWLLTDADADKTNIINLTQFQKWPWGFEIDRMDEFTQVRGGEACNWWLNSERNWGVHKKYPDLWRKLIHAAWAKIEAEKEYEISSSSEDGTNKDKEVKLDEIDSKIIEIHQLAQEQGIKMPSNQKIATVLYNKHITQKELSRETIRKRTKRLRQAGLIGSPDDNKDVAKRCTDKHIEDLDGRGQTRQKF